MKALKAYVERKNRWGSLLNGGLLWDVNDAQDRQQIYASIQSELKHESKVNTEEARIRYCELVTAREELKTLDPSLENATMIPAHTKGALDRYVNHGLLPGDFLMSVLTNDLFGAVARADSANRAALPEICSYVYNELPSDCWGSPDKVDRFIRIKFGNKVTG